VLDEVESQINQWESKLGLRVDVMAALSYIMGPISGERWISLGREREREREGLTFYSAPASNPGNAK
jgi:hypothetical protein